LFFQKEVHAIFKNISCFLAPFPSTPSSLFLALLRNYKSQKELLSVAFLRLLLSVQVQKAFRFRRGVNSCERKIASSIAIGMRIEKHNAY
jgi:hypothetical protein